MITTPSAVKTVALLSWSTDDGINEMLCQELENLGYAPLPFAYGSPIPASASILLSFGPYGPLLPVWQQATQLPAERRPVVVHWNTEGMPDLRLPESVMRRLSSQRSRLGFLAHANPQPQGLSGSGRRLLRALLGNRLARFCYLGDYEYAYRQGWLHVLADTSAVYQRQRARFGLPTLYAPWGATPPWYADLKLERDIEVLWMGTRGTFRRSFLLDQIRRELRSHGVRMHVADNVENPFIFKAERTQVLNRARITLNLTRTWYDDNFSRLALAASNRSLIVSEPLLPHCPEIEADAHYVSAPISRLTESILYYLSHEHERQQIVERAYQLVTNTLRFGPTLKRILEAAAGCRQAGILNSSSARA
jgi:hypothetical protein